MMERLLDVEVTQYGTIIEEIEMICCMTGYRRRFLVHHIGEGFFFRQRWDRDRRRREGNEQVDKCYREDAAYEIVDQKKGSSPCLYAKPS